MLQQINYTFDKKTKNGSVIFLLLHLLPDREIKLFLAPARFTRLRYSFYELTIPSAVPGVRITVRCHRKRRYLYKHCLQQFANCVITAIVIKVKTLLYEQIISYQGCFKFLLKFAQSCMHDKFYEKCAKF